MKADLTLPKKYSSVFRNNFFKPKIKQEEGNTPAKKDPKANDYNPGKKNYHPIDDACWKHGERYRLYASDSFLPHLPISISRISSPSFQD